MSIPQKRKYGHPEGKRRVQAAATRQKIMDAGRTLFAENGYQAAMMSEIAARSGVTLGALYHHFIDKEDLFLAVFKEVQLEIEEKGQHAIDIIDEADPWLEFRRATTVLLEEVTGHKDFLRILLLDGPLVLGWSRWREIQQALGLRLIYAALHKAMAVGALPPLPIEPLAHMLLAMGHEATLLIAHGERTPSDIAKVTDTVDAVLAAIAAISRTNLPPPKGPKIGS